MPLTKSQEDYLKLIWHAGKNGHKATVKMVADGLHVKSPTVHAMFRQLDSKGWITYNKNEGAILLDKGEDVARKLVRKHRLIETFLETVLEMDEQHIHEEAEKLEHVISDALMYRIDAFLGYPEKDPHGSSIPPWEREEFNSKLDMLTCGESFIIKTMQLSDLEQQYYKNTGLTNGSLWTVIEEPPGNSCLMIGNGKKFLAIPSEIAKNITVTTKK